MNRWFVALLLTVSACAGTGTAGSTSAPATNPQSGITTTIATPSIVDGGLIEIDPATLVPTMSGEPILVGNSHDGVVSRNGRWAAVRTWDHVGEVHSINLVDLEDGTVLASADEYAESTTVSNDGTIYYFVQGATPRIMRLRADGVEGVDTKLPADLPLTNSLSVLSEYRIGYLAAPPAIGPATLVVVDGEVARATELGTIRAGGTETGSEKGLPIVESYTPAVAWDLVNGRALVISAEEDLIVTVDLETGEASENPWSTITGSFDGWTFGIAVARAKGVSFGARREAFLTDDGARLIVATQTNELTDDNTETSTPGKLLMVDTTTWVATEVDVEVSTLRPSLDGSRLLAIGSSTTFDATEEEASESSPVYVVDTSTGELTGEFSPTRGEISGIQWSPTSDIFYIHSLADQANIDIVDLTLGQAVGSVEFREMSLIGEAGLMAFHLDLD